MLAGFLALGVVGAMALGMAALMLLGFKNIWRGIASAGWPTAEATVTGVEMTSQTTRDTRRKSRTTTYHAELTFHYAVDGREFSTDQVQWGQTLGSGDPAEAVVLALRYPEGSRVTVRYNPLKPEEAVVRPGLTGSAFLLPGAALAFLLFLVPACFMISRLFLHPGAESLSAGSFPMGRAIACFLVIPILMGTAMLLLGAQNLLLANRSRTWPEVPGTWLVDVPTNQVPGIDQVRDHRGFAYVYRYETGGIPRYQCVRWFGQGTASGNGADAEIHVEFPRGQPLKVHYDPEDSDLAVLSPGVRKFAWILPLGGLGFIAFGCVGILTAVRRGRDPGMGPRGTSHPVPRDERPLRGRPRIKSGNSLDGSNRFR